MNAINKRAYVPLFYVFCFLFFIFYFYLPSVAVGLGQGCIYLSAFSLPSRAYEYYAKRRTLEYAGSLDRPVAAAATAVGEADTEVMAQQQKKRRRRRRRRCSETKVAVDVGRTRYGDPSIAKNEWPHVIGRWMFSSLWLASFSCTCS